MRQYTLSVYASHTTLIFTAILDILSVFGVN